LLTVIAFLGYLVGLVVSGITSFDRFPSSGPGVSSTTLRGIEQRVAREIRGARQRRVPIDHLITEVSAILEGADGERTTFSLTRDEQSMLESASESERWRWLERGGAIQRLTSVVFSDLGLAELSLQVDSRDVYDKYDRMRAEAEFRRAIAPPVAALSVAVAVRCVVEFGSLWPLLALIGLVPAWALWASGGQRLLQSRDLMIQAILGGQAVSPTLKLISDLEPSPVDV
jgi:hypothetical protein